MDDTTPPDPQPTPPSDTAVAPTTTEAMPLAESVPPPSEITPPTETPQAVPEAAPPENTPTPETPASPAPEPTPIADTPPVVVAESVPEPLPVATPPATLTLEQMLARLSPTELKALFKKYLLDIGAKGRAKSKAQLKEKRDKIIAHLGVHGRITHKEVMQLTHSAKTTATRILQGLEKEGKVVQHGGYKARDAYYTLRL